jgi:hypothetical protein
MKNDSKAMELLIDGESFNHFLSKVLLKREKTFQPWHRDGITQFA